MKEISICPNNKKFKLYEDGVIIKEMNNEEFLKYIKDDDREEKYYEIAEMIHEDMCLLFYVYARLNISVIKFYKMENIDDIAKDKYNYYELLKHLNEYFNVNDEYFYIAYNCGDYNKEEICSMDESRVHDYFLYNTNDELRKIFMKDPEVVYNVILEYLKENK